MKIIDFLKTELQSIQELKNGIVNKTEIDVRGR